MDMEKKMRRIISFCVLVFGISSVHAMEELAIKEDVHRDVVTSSNSRIEQKSSHPVPKKVALSGSVLADEESFSEKEKKLSKPSYKDRSYDGVEVTINGLEKRIEKLEHQNKLQADQIRIMERTIGAMAGNEPVYYRFMRADLVIQLTVCCTIGYAFATAFTGGSPGEVMFAILSAYMFYGFFKFTRDLGTVAGNVIFKRPNN